MLLLTVVEHAHFKKKKNYSFLSFLAKKLKKVTSRFAFLRHFALSKQCFDSCGGLLLAIGKLNCPCQPEWQKWLTSWPIRTYYRGEEHSDDWFTKLFIQARVSLCSRVAQLSTARSGINICYSTKLRESKNTNFSFLPFTSDPFFKPRSSPASWAECARARPS